LRGVTRRGQAWIYNEEAKENDSLPSWKVKVRNHKKNVGPKGGEDVFGKEIRGMPFSKTPWK